jgi:hypothetical protein
LKLVDVGGRTKAGFLPCGFTQALGQTLLQLPTRTVSRLFRSSALVRSARSEARLTAAIRPSSGGAAAAAWTRSRRSRCR